MILLSSRWHLSFGVRSQGIQEEHPPQRRSRHQSGHHPQHDMQLGAAQEIVDVTSEAPLVDTTSTQLGAVVNDRAVSELPLNSRDTYQFLQLQPE